ncbi:MAG TPA: CAP domain-containing protein, partial [Mycobacteriales bacterium]|nr:CAP domain-containing protein [Mycobacteriales bacterium]
MRARLAAIVALGVLLGVAALLAPTAGAESSPSAYANRLVSLINNARAQNGLKALTVTSGTSTVAANWTNHLDQEQALSHNPDLGHQLETHGSPDWTAYGENVGDGPTSSADTLFQAYMNSPEHRDNILGSAYRYLGIGVVFDGSTAWNTLDFVDQYSSSSSRPHTTSTTTTSPQPKAKPRTTTTRPKTVARPVAPTHRVTVAHAPAVSHQAPAPRRVAAAPRAAQVRGVASSAPVALPALPAVAKAAISLPAPVHLPHDSRDTAPFIAAAALIVL